MAAWLLVRELTIFFYIVTPSHPTHFTSMSMRLQLSSSFWHCQHFACRLLGRRSYWRNASWPQSFWSSFCSRQGPFPSFGLAGCLKVPHCLQALTAANTGALLMLLWQRCCYGTCNGLHNAQKLQCLLQCQALLNHCLLKNVNKHVCATVYY